MSQRHIRKLYGGNTLLPVQGNSDEEFEPLYAKNSPSQFASLGMGLSSHSESEHESTDAVGMESVSPETNLKKKKIKKKKQQRKLGPKPSSKGNLEGLDDIDRAVQEVQELMGPSADVPSAPEQQPADPRLQLLAVQAKHLNPNNEMLRKFGADGQEVNKRCRQHNLNRLLRKAVIVPVTDTRLFKKVGLSMSILRRENDCTYFAFDHNREYQRVHREFLRPDHPMSLEDAQKNMHVEALLECADALFGFELYSAANKLLELIISYMHYVAHPSFNLTNSKVRLEYKYTENRPFHIVVMKYMYMMSSRACHRSALETAKVLLNLDPSDPLAVLFVVDTLALRAREHQWLIQAVNFWSTERDAGFLFNIQYSFAMAHFHVSRKNKEDFSKADELLQAAMLRFPGVVMNLLQNETNPQCARIKACPLFAAADETSGKDLKELMFLYAKLSWYKWREPAVLEWFTRNASQLADKYEQDKDVQEKAKNLANERLNLFRGWPDQIVRHLSVIRPMSEILVDGAVPRVAKSPSADPAPPAEGVSRYGYGLEVHSASASSSLPTSLFFSVLPQFRSDIDIQRQVMELIEATSRALRGSESPDEVGLPLEMLADIDVDDTTTEVEYSTDTDDDEQTIDRLHAAEERYNPLYQRHNTSDDRLNTSDDRNITPDKRQTTSDEHFNTSEECFSSPAYRHVMPADRDVTPADRHVTPADRHVTPADRHVTPADRHVTPADRHGTPDDRHVPSGEQ